MITALRGMKDIIDDSPKFLYILETACAVAKRYGFKFVETPLLEETALFKRSVGESSDIVGKEMYQFLDKGGNDVCLRPEGTAGIVRAFVEKKLDRSDATNRFFYHGAMFRYERPQKGRFRLFHQFGCESFGETSVLEDAQIILMIRDIFDELKVGFALEINSLGCADCMPNYRGKLKDFLASKHDEICDDCKRRAETNPIRVLDCKSASCQDLYQNAPLISDHLCASCSEDFEKLKGILNSSDLAFSHNKKLVRGLDYYNKTAFEFVSSNIGAQNAIAGGGRYDALVEYLGGKATPAVGFAIGVERIYDLVELPKTNRDGFYMGAMDSESVLDLMLVAPLLRRQHKVVFENSPKSLKAHLKSADRVDAKYCVVVGENEQKAGEVWIKNLESKTEKTIAKLDLIKGEW